MIIKSEYDEVFGAYINLRFDKKYKGFVEG